MINCFFAFLLGAFCSTVVGQVDIVEGCTDPAACNYDPTASIDDGSCYFGGAGGDGPCSFELSTNQGYAPLTIKGTNLITDAGASYLWDFGNGQTSTALNPMFSYDTPGTYTVNVQTDVSELSLTGVNITTLGGGWDADIEDFLGPPDPYFVLSGPQGEIYTSFYVNGIETPYFYGFNIPLDPGTTYNIAFYDSDGVQTGDDFLGASDFTPSGAGSLTVSNSTTADLYLSETQLVSFNESYQVIVFEGLETDSDNNGVSDNQEVYGCTYPLAENFSSSVTRDDGSCIFPCEGVVNTNVFDWDGDYVVTVTDFLMMLSVYGDTDVDLDGVWDSGDDCVDVNACNYANDPSEPCAYIDVLGVCGGGCEGDEDNDGICDDIDTCIGVEDECGVCNGPGPTEIVIDQIITTYDSVYLPVDGEWFVYAVNVDTTFTYTCAPFFGDCGDPVSYQGYDYATVLIGEQCWFAENLRNEHYENGDAIPSNLSDSEWSSATSGAVAVFGEGSNICYSHSPDGDACDSGWSLNEYGRLYNWYAVDDSRGLCPSGWHVPTDGEWTMMTDHLGGESVAGGHMKTDYGWYNGGNGTNSSGFSGLPGGSRGKNGYTDNTGKNGYWWSSSPNGTAGWSRYLDYLFEYVVRPVNENVGNTGAVATNPRHGYSVRCVRDAE